MNKAFDNTVSRTFIAALVLLSGCGHKPTYKLKQLVPYTCYDQVVKKTETGSVTVRCSTLTRNDLRTIFGKQGDALLGLRSHKRIIPVQLHIENNSEHTWTLSPYDIRLPLADGQMVKDRFVKAATKKGIASYTIGNGLGIGVAVLGAATSILHPVAGASLIGAGCSMILITPAISHNKTAHISQQNAHYCHSLDTLTLTDDVVIYPHQTINKLIFVQFKHMPEQFGLRLCNYHDQDHTMFYSLYLDQHTR